MERHESTDIWSWLSTREDDGLTTVKNFIVSLQNNWFYGIKHNMKEKLIDWSQCNELTLILDKFPIFQGAGLAVANSPRVSLVVISIKLTSVMGMTWILALITNWPQFAFLQFPSTILNSLQGNMLNDLRQRMSKTILFQLSSMAFPSDLEESDVFFVFFSKRWLVLWRDGRPTAGCSEKELEARVALSCASSNSYASFVLSKLPACLLTHEPIFNWGRYKNVFFLCCYSLTGFFIMLCFTTTKKVRGLIRDKLRKRRIGTERQTTMTRCSGGTNTEMASDSPIMKKGKIVMAWHK